jgi:hypothetical protein
MVVMFQEKNTIIDVEEKYAKTLYQEQYRKITTLL